MSIRPTAAVGFNSLAIPRALATGVPTSAPGAIELWGMWEDTVVPVPEEGYPHQPMEDRFSNLKELAMRSPGARSWQKLANRHRLPTESG